MARPNQARIAAVKAKLAEKQKGTGGTAKGAEDDAYVTYESGKTGGKVRGPLNRMVPGDVRTDRPKKRQPMPRLIPPAQVRANKQRSRVS